MVAWSSGELRALRLRARAWRRYLAASVLCAAATMVAMSPQARAVQAACPNSAERVGASASLPDCRAYEMVTPLDKGGYNAVNPILFSDAQVSPSGTSIFYEGNSSFPDAVGNDIEAAHVSTRTSGWQTTDLTPPTPSIGPAKEYFIGYFPTEKLGEVIVKAPLVLTEGANPVAYNLYAQQIGGGYRWVNDLPLPTPAQQTCSGEEGIGGCTEDTIGFAGASANLTHVLFETNAQLLPNAPVAGIPTLYESVAGGGVKLVGTLPDGLTAVGGATAGDGSRMGGSYPFVTNAFKGDRRVEHAISASGNRVVFEAASDEGVKPAEEGQLGMTEVYDRIEGSQTIELSGRAAGASPADPGAQPAEFWAASPDGSHVYFTSKAELTSTSDTGTADNSQTLYEYDLEDHSVIELSHDTNPVDSATGPGVLGVVGVGESATEGSYIYFVATGQLVEGQGVDGKPNLYMIHGHGQPGQPVFHGRPVFIATLEPANTTSVETEEHELGDSLDWTPFATVMRAYVTPDGRHLAFSSSAKIPTQRFPSGYDNRTIGDGEVVSEIYEYSAPDVQEEESGATGAVVCASCAPNGASPTGPAYLAGTGEEGTTVHPVSSSNPFEHLRAVSDNGARVFFTATPFAAESAADSEETSQPKLYEFESTAEGTCVAATGCVYRLSEADNPTPALFLGASASGGDVFFATYGRLVAPDSDSLIDVYDAREFGESPSVHTSTPCESSCRGPAAVEPESPSIVSGLIGPTGNLTTSGSPAVKSKPVVKPAAKQPPGCRAASKGPKKKSKQRKHKGSLCKPRGNSKTKPQGKGKAASRSRKQPARRTGR